MLTDMLRAVKFSFSPLFYTHFRYLRPQATLFSKGLSATVHTSSYPVKRQEILRKLTVSATIIPRTT